MTTTFKDGDHVTMSVNLVGKVTWVGDNTVEIERDNGYTVVHLADVVAFDVADRPLPTKPGDAVWTGRLWRRGRDSSMAHWSARDKYGYMIYRGDEDMPTDWIGVVVDGKLQVAV